MTLDLHVLALKLTEDILRGLATNLNPLTGEKGTGAKDKADIENSMNRVTYHGR